MTEIIKEHNISREEFQKIITNSIEHAFGAEEERDIKRKLHDVACDKKYVAFGTWYLSNNISCGCPAWEAGLAGTKESQANGTNWKILPFTIRFDYLISIYLDWKNESHNLYGILVIDD